jgi:hypothetical protein
VGAGGRLGGGSNSEGAQVNIQAEWPETLGALRSVAEQDPNDIIANAASALVVRLETVGTVWGMQLSELSDLDRQLIQYSVCQLRQQ